MSLRLQVRRGASRLVILVGDFAIKIPLVTKGGAAFLLGCLGNLNERRIWIDSRGDCRLARTLIAFPLGVLAVAERHDRIVGRRLTRDEMLSLPLADFSGESGVDDNGHNVAHGGDGLVVIDYGSPGLMYVADGPTLVRGMPRTG